MVAGPGIALGNLLNAISRAVATDLTFLFVAAIALTLAIGRRRSLARDFDLACVALVPFVIVELVTGLAVWLAPGLARDPAGMIAGVVAYGWAGAILVLAWRRARRRPPPESAEPAESEDPA